MTEIAKQLQEAIRHRISCIDKIYLNGFAGTGRSKKRTAQDAHTIARHIMDRTFTPYSFRWKFGNGEPATEHEIYLTVFTTLFDIDDEDAKRWTDRAEWHASRDEAVRDMVKALMLKFDIKKRRFVSNTIETVGDPGGAPGVHNLSGEWVDD